MKILSALEYDSIKEKKAAAIVRRDEGLARVSELKKLIDTIESEIIAENILIDKYNVDLSFIEYQTMFG